MSEIGQWSKSAKLDKGMLRTALSLTITESRQQKYAFVGILIVSDACANGSQIDSAAQAIQIHLDKLRKHQAVVKVTKIVFCDSTEVTNTLRNWSDNLGLDLIFTVGGSGFRSTHIVPEATKSVIEKELLGITVSMLTSAQRLDPNAMLFRGIAGVRKNVLIINLPEETEDAVTYLDIVLPCLPTALDVLKNVPVVALERSFVFITPGQFQDNSRSRSLPLEHVNPLPIRSIPSVSPSNVHHTNNGLHTLSAANNGLHTLSAENNGHHVNPNAATHHSTSLNSSGIPQEILDRSNQSDSEDMVMPLTERDLLGGHSSMDDVVAQEALRIVGQSPVSRIASDSAVSGLGSISKPARRPRSLPFTAMAVDAAYATIFALTSTTSTISIFYKDAIDHVLAEDVTAVTSVPPQPTSILDGYAVVASDTPCDFEVLPESSFRVLPLGKGVRINTGGPVPPGANAVVPVEETLLLAEANNGITELSVRCTERATPGQHIRPEGSDVMKGGVVLKEGTKLDPIKMAFLASVGVRNIRVHRLPVVAVISFGEKLREPDDLQLFPGEIRDTNRMTLLLDLKKRGFPTVDMGIVLGGASELKTRLIMAHSKADVIITTGGSVLSVNDCVKTLLVEIGCTLHVERVVIKTGAPTSFATLEGQRGKKYFFSLAGIPVPAYIGYYLFTLPCLKRLCGIKDPRWPVTKARVSTNILLENVPDYKRACLRKNPSDNIPWADVTGRQIISRMFSLVEADVLLILPAKTDQRLAINRGDTVDAILIS